MNKFLILLSITCLLIIIVEALPQSDNTNELGSKIAKFEDKKNSEKIMKDKWDSYKVNFFFRLCKVKVLLYYFDEWKKTFL